MVRIPQTAAWVVQTLLTEENVPRIAQEWNRMMLRHREEIFSLLTPVVRDVILDIERHVERELPLFLAAHREELRSLSEELRAQFMGEEFQDFFEEELWPIAEPRIDPVVREIGREIWGRLPLWSFSWRIMYQSLPFTSDEHVRKAWRHFRDEEIVPILRSHSPQIVEAAREVAKEVLSRNEVTAHLRAVFESLITSPRFHALSQVFLREVILDNPRFHEAMRRRWRSPAVQRAVRVATRHIEPAVRRMADVVLGTRKEGITEEFTKVLRSQILLKDLQHIVIDPGSPGAPPLPGDAVLPARIEWDRHPDASY